MNVHSYECALKVFLLHYAGGQLSERFGAKYFFGLGVGCTALLTVLTPLATRLLGLAGLLACRALEGALQVRLTIARCSMLFSLRSYVSDALFRTCFDYCSIPDQRREGTIEY